MDVRLLGVNLTDQTVTTISPSEADVETFLGGSAWPFD